MDKKETGLQIHNAFLWKIFFKFCIFLINKILGGEPKYGCCVFAFWEKKKKSSYVYKLHYILESF